jgi:3-methyl-2-oxobutanoate hydroxymethyltransferase
MPLTQSARRTGMSSYPLEPNPRSETHTRKVTLTDLADMKRQAQKIVAVAAYDAPSGRLADLAGIDCVLVGDSAVMTMFGRESTVSATMDEMMMLTRAVVRGVRRALVIADMPFGAYQVSDVSAVENAIRFAKAGADAVKLEGAGTSTNRVAAIVAAGVPVVGHLGLTPQSATLLGGYKAQGRSAQQARRLCADALALERAGCFAIVLEAIPAAVAGHISAAVRVPTIGIGAGASCDGQILVWHDLLGLSDGQSARFVKRYADLGNEILVALKNYAGDVRTSRFPEERHTYSMSKGELDLFDACHRAPA